VRYRPSGALVFTLFIASCVGRDVVPTGPGQPSSPQPEAVPGRLTPWSALIDTEVPGTVLTLRVRVTDSSYLIPIAGVRVNLVITGGGAIDSQAVVTDTSGYASLGFWTLGDAPGTNTLVASATGLPPVTFTVIGRLPDTVAIYDLQTVGGKQVPISFGNGDSFDGGSYVLFDNGRCVFSWVFDNKPAPMPCNYVTNNSTSIDFYTVVAAPQPTHIAWSTGMLNGPYMTVTYYTPDEPTEVYLLRTNSSAMRWSSPVRH
jgi:hypothetical protein